MPYDNKNYTVSFSHINPQYALIIISRFHQCKYTINKKTDQIILYKKIFGILILLKTCIYDIKALSLQKKIYNIFYYLCYL